MQDMKRQRTHQRRRHWLTKKMPGLYTSISRSSQSFAAIVSGKRVIHWNVPKIITMCALHLVTDPWGTKESLYLRAELMLCWAADCSTSSGGQFKLKWGSLLLLFYQTCSVQLQYNGGQEMIPKTILQTQICCSLNSGPSSNVLSRKLDIFIYFLKFYNRNWRVGFLSKFFSSWFQSQNFTLLITFIFE